MKISEYSCGMVVVAVAILHGPEYKHPQIVDVGVGSVLYTCPLCTLYNRNLGITLGIKFRGPLKMLRQRRNADSNATAYMHSWRCGVHRFRAFSMNATMVWLIRSIVTLRVAQQHSQYCWSRARRGAFHCDGYHYYSIMSSSCL